MFLTREVGGEETFLGSVFVENFIMKTKRGDSKMNEFLKEARKYVVRSMWNLFLWAVAILQSTKKCLISWSMSSRREKEQKMKRLMLRTEIRTYYGGMNFVKLSGRREL